MIPVKCVTCGMVLADKYRYFVEKTRAIKLQKGIHPDKIEYLDKHTVDKTAEGQVLDDLKLINMCCRRVMLTHVDIE